MLDRNRIDMARLMMGREGGYTLRTFKKMVKRDKADYPDKYEAFKEAYKNRDVSAEIARRLGYFADLEANTAAAAPATEGETVLDIENLDDPEAENECDATKEGMNVDVHGSNKFGVFVDDEEDVEVDEDAKKSEMATYEKHFGKLVEFEEGKED